MTKPLARFCVDELVQIISYLPYYDQTSCVQNCVALQAYFSVITNEAYLTQNLDEGPSAVIKQAVEQGIGELIKDHPKTANLLSPDRRERLCRLIVIGMTYDTRINSTDETIHMEDFFNHLDGQLCPGVIAWAVVFRTVKRLEVYLENYYVWLPVLLFAIQCMPRLTHLAFHETVDLTRNVLQFENSVVKNRWFSVTSSSTPIKVGHVRKDLNKFVVDQDVPSSDCLHLLGSHDNPHMCYKASDHYTIMPFYLPGIKCKRLASLMNENLVMLNEERLECMLALVDDCDCFNLNVSSWECITKEPLFRPVYEAIVSKVNRGQTIHSCREKLSSDYLIDVNKFLGSTKDIGVLIEFAKSGIDIALPRANPTMLPPLLIYQLMTYGYHLYRAPMLTRFVNEVRGEFSKTPLAQYMLKQSRINTLATLSTTATMEALTRSDKTQLFEFFTQAFQQDFIEHVDRIRQSIQNHPFRWKIIVTDLFRAKQTFVLQHLLRIAPEQIKRHSLTAFLQRTDTQRCHIFETWLFHHGVIEEKNVLHSDTMKHYQQPDEHRSKRQRLE